MHPPHRRGLSWSISRACGTIEASSCYRISTKSVTSLSLPACLHTTQTYLDNGVQYLPASRMPNDRHAQRGSLSSIEERRGGFPDGTGGLVDTISGIPSLCIGAPPGPGSGMLQTSGVKQIPSYPCKNLQNASCSATRAPHADSVLYWSGVRISPSDFFFLSFRLRSLHEMALLG